MIDVNRLESLHEVLSNMELWTGSNTELATELTAESPFVMDEDTGFMYVETTEEEMFIDEILHGSQVLR